jgi:hypothetical protein
VVAVNRALDTSPMRKGSELTRGLGGRRAAR